MTDTPMPLEPGDSENAVATEYTAPQGEGSENTVAYSSETTPATAAATSRPSVIAPAAATGRRKEAVARVRIVPGSGKWTINGRTLDA